MRCSVGVDGCHGERIHLFATTVQCLKLFRPVLQSGSCTYSWLKTRPNNDITAASETFKMRATVHYYFFSAGGKANPDSSAALRRRTFDRKAGPCLMLIIIKG